MTFLMVFLIQHDQNRDAKALQLKLDERVAVHKAASNRLIDLEGLGEAEIAELERRFRRLAERTREGKRGEASVEHVSEDAEERARGPSSGARRRSS